MAPYFGEIPGLPGVWSNEATLEECRKMLQEVLEDWLLLKLRDNEEIPPLGGTRNAGWVKQSVTHHN